MSSSLTPEALTFYTEAAEYCLLIEALCDRALEAPYRSLLGCMSRLAKSGNELPWMNAEESISSIRLTHEEWSVLANRISAVIALGVGSIIEFYVELKDEAGMVRVSMLFDDLADIYRDLSEGLELWRQKAISNAVWQWRFGFESHWGEHLYNALATIHELHYRLGYE